MNFYKLLALAFTIAATGLAHAGPTSMTRETLREYPDGTSYWEVDVTCSTSREPRLLQRKTDSKAWCAKDAPDICKKDKIAMAALVCSSKYRATLTNEVAAEEQQNETAQSAPQQQAITQQAVLESAPASEESVANDSSSIDLEQQRDQLSVEKERLLIEQQRLELQRQALELKKEELRLKSLLEETRQTTVPAKTAPVEQPKEKVTSSNGKTSTVPTLFRTKNVDDPQ